VRLLAVYEVRTRNLAVDGWESKKRLLVGLLNDEGLGIQNAVVFLATKIYVDHVYGVSNMFIFFAHGRCFW
jgi:hypothetical protein